MCHEIQSDLSEENYEVTRYPLKVDKKPPRDEGKIKNWIGDQCN